MNPDGRATLMGHDGVVAFFDILGYQNIILNNNIEDAATLVADVVISIPGTITDELQGFVWGKRKPSRLSSTVLKEIEWYMFSDTVFAFLPVGDRQTTQSAQFRWMLFLGWCTLLQRRLFDAGLPVRGAIDSGRFFVRGNCFVGHPIVRAYRASETQDWSGCILTQAARDQYQRLFKDGRSSPVARHTLYLVCEYMAPLRDAESRRVMCLRWGAAGKLTSPPKGSLREYVLAAFLRHNKDIPPDVHPKLHNTEIFLQYLVNTHTVPGRSSAEQ